MAVFDLVGWVEATPGTGTNGVTAALNDQQYPPYGDYILPKAYAQRGNQYISYILGSFCAAVSTGEEYRFRQPGLTPQDYQNIKIMLEADLDPSQGYDHYWHRPLPVFANKQLTGVITNGTDESCIIGAMLGNQPITRAMIDQVGITTHKIIGVGDTTQVALTWTGVPITWDQDLPAGRYAVVGMKFGYWITSGALANLGRLVLTDVPYRPGVPGVLMEADHEEFQSATYLPCWDWPLDPLISFDHLHLPNLQCLSNAAITDQNVELSLVKIE